MSPTARVHTWNTRPGPDQIDAHILVLSSRVASEPQGNQAQGDREQAVGQDRAYLWSERAQEVGLTLNSQELWIPQSFPSGPMWVPDCCLSQEGPAHHSVFPQHLPSEWFLSPLLNFAPISFGANSAPARLGSGHPGWSGSSSVQDASSPQSRGPSLFRHGELWRAKQKMAPQVHVPKGKTPTFWAAMTLEGKEADMMVTEKVLRAHLGSRWRDRIRRQRHSGRTIAREDKIRGEQHKEVWAWICTQREMPRKASHLCQSRELQKTVNKYLMKMKSEI